MIGVERWASCSTGAWPAGLHPLIVAWAQRAAGTAGRCADPVDPAQQPALGAWGAVGVNIFEYLLDPTTWLGPGNTLDLLLEHLAYTAAAVGIGALIAIPLGILIGHTGRGSFLVIGLTNGARAIPSLGLLVLVVYCSAGFW